MQALTTFGALMYEPKETDNIKTYSLGFISTEISTLLEYLSSRVLTFTSSPSDLHLVFSGLVEWASTFKAVIRV